MEKVDLLAEIYRYNDLGYEICDSNTCDIRSTIEHLRQISKMQEWMSIKERYDRTMARCTWIVKCLKHEILPNIEETKRVYENVISGVSNICDLQNQLDILEKRVRTLLNFEYILFLLIDNIQKSK